MTSVASRALHARRSRGDAGWRALALLVLAAFAPIGHATSIQDGPYLTKAGDVWTARWITGDDSSPQVHEERIGATGEVAIAAVGAHPAFKVKLRPPAKTAASEVRLAPATPLFVLADTHGEFEIAVELLTRQKIIDSRLRWSFGKGHLAVLGDVFDRGPNHTEILWLLYELEAQAARAGGAVHVMLGIHESMALGGDERYLIP
jgi:hypothetical protein